MTERHYVPSDQSFAKKKKEPEFDQALRSNCQFVESGEHREPL